MNVVECAKLLGKSPQFIRIGLQEKVLPFGYAIKMSDRWTYHISDAKVSEYLGTDIDVLTKRKNVAKSRIITL